MGLTGVFADRDGVVAHIPLAKEFTNDRLQAAIERVARKLGQDINLQNPILNSRLPDGLPRRRGRSSIIDQWPDAYRPQIQPLVHSDELVAAGSMPSIVRDDVVNLIQKRKNGIISGGTGSGKSTLMKALLTTFPCMRG